jgi:hypothetical protein
MGGRLRWAGPGLFPGLAGAIAVGPAAGSGAPRDEGRPAHATVPHPALSERISSSSGSSQVGETAEDPLGRAAARYRAGRFDEAEEAAVLSVRSSAIHGASTRPGRRAVNRPTTNQSTRPGRRAVNGPTTNQSTRPGRRAVNRPTTNQSTRPGRRAVNRPTTNQSTRPGRRTVNGRTTIRHGEGRAFVSLAARIAPRPDGRS